MSAVSVGGRVLRIREVPILLALLVVVVITSLVSSSFASQESLQAILIESSVIGLLASAQTMLIIMRHIDLSVGSTTGLVAFLVGQNSAMNAGVALLLMKRSGIKIEEPLMYVQRQKERMESVLDYLKPFIMDQGLKSWDFHTISIYCFLDWALFRGMINIEKRSECQAFLEKHKNRKIVTSTAIPV